MRRPKFIGDRLGRRLDDFIRRPGQERSADWYDRKFGSTASYRASYNDSPYYFLWAVIADRVRRNRLNTVFEVGCGTGQLAALLFDQGIAEYAGFDFSSEAIALARQAAPYGRFWVADARDRTLYAEIACDVLICTEVLEHIDEDLEVVAGFPDGTRCVFSVPNHDSQGHVRFFDDVAGVEGRYGRYFGSLDIAELRTAGSQTHRIFLADGYRNDIED
jgi:SAM-dependent methyltransferase